MQEELERFNDAIMRLSAPAISIYGGALPGMLGRSAAEQGSLTTAADALYELKRQVADFNRQLSRPNNAAQLKPTAQAVEASLLEMATLDVLSQEQADNLIDKLHKLAGNG